jgi:TolB protein
MSAARRWVLVSALFLLAHRAPAQQITLGARGTASQPSLIVLAGAGIDSVRAIVQRDLLNSDRFTIVPLSDSVGTLRAPIDSALLRGLAPTTWVVELQPAANGIEMKLYDVATGVIRQRATMPLDRSGIGDTRITIHRASDQVVNWTGGIGIAATRIALKIRSGSDDAIWRIDSDGANLVRVTRPGCCYFSTPAWSPDGTTIAYSENRDGRWTLYLQKLSSGTRTALTSSAPGDSYGGNFSPDGRFMVYTHGLPAGSAIETVDVRQNCCAHELTHDKRYADNVSPSYSPDQRHILYISSRTGTPQVWVMDDDGLSPEQLVAPQFRSDGRALDANSPALSPDGARLVFSREVERGNRQLFTASAAGGLQGQLTAEGLNDDPSWAPDSRHVVFKSNRTGREQLWIIDIETRVPRQLTNTPGLASYPAWSHLFGTNP